jgi:predicted alpha/beta-fold hydrolase
VRARFAVERVEHEDGGHNELHWLLPEADGFGADSDSDGPVRGGGAAAAAVPAPRGPVLVILHGLVGGSSERYVRWMARSFVRAHPGGGAVVFNARGCGGSDISSPSLFSAAHTADLRHAVEVLRARDPARPLFAVGYSLGAGLLTKFVSEEGARCAFAGAVAVCPSFDLVRSTLALERGVLPRQWNGLLASSLTKFLRRHLPALQRLGAPMMGAAAGGAGAGTDTGAKVPAAGDAVVKARLPPFQNGGRYAAPETPTSPRDDLRRPLDVTAALTAKRCRDFDGNTVAPMFGYVSADAYYADASTAHRLQHIRVPYLALLSEDDPICVAETIPRDAFARGASGTAVIAAIASEGGHVGFAQARDWTGPSWDNDVVCEFVAAVLARRAATS